MTTLTAKRVKTLYVHRPLLNTRVFLKHFREQGFKNLLDASDLHVTIAFSRTPVDWKAITPNKNHLRVSNAVSSRVVSPLGDEGAIVLKFKSAMLHDRWETLCSFGAAWDWPSYQPHVTLTYIGDTVDLAKVQPYTGVLSFGPEKFSEVIEDWEVGRE